MGNRDEVLRTYGRREYGGASAKRFPIRKCPAESLESGPSPFLRVHDGRRTGCDIDHGWRQRRRTPPTRIELVFAYFATFGTGLHDFVSPTSKRIRLAVVHDLFSKPSEFASFTPAAGHEQAGPR